MNDPTRFQMPGTMAQLGNYGYGSGTGSYNFGTGSMPGSQGAVQPGGGLFDSFKNIFSGGGNDGQGSFGRVGDIVGSEGFQSGLGAFSTLADMYTGFKSLGLAKDQLSFQKKAWNKNYQAQVKDYENNLKDRWAARNASAEARGGSTMPGMNEWVSDRAIGGGSGGGRNRRGNTGVSDYRASSPQEFFAARNQQADAPIRPKGRG